MNLGTLHSASLVPIDFVRAWERKEASKLGEGVVRSGLQPAVAVQWNHHYTKESRLGKQASWLPSKVRGQRRK